MCMYTVREMDKHGRTLEEEMKDEAIKKLRALADHMKDVPHYKTLHSDKDLAVAQVKIFYGDKLHAILDEIEAEKVKEDNELHKWNDPYN